MPSTVTLPSPTLRAPVLDKATIRRAVVAAEDHRFFAHRGVDLQAIGRALLAIGTQETSPLEMASAYRVFANHGVRVEPTPVLRIADTEDKTVEDNRTPAGQRVLDAAVADNVTAVLEGVITQGTGRRAGIGRPAAGKTGTSQNWENAWFAGYTPTLSAAVWMGYPQANITMANVHGVAHVTGGTLPAMIWHDFMVEAVKDVPPLPFAQAGPLPSRAEFEARARRAADKRLQERGGIDLTPAGVPADLSPEGPWWTPPPRPHAKAPPKPEATPAPSSPPPNSPPPSGEPESSTTTTAPPPRSPRWPPLPPIPR